MIREADDLQDSVAHNMNPPKEPLTNPQVRASTLRMNAALMLEDAPEQNNEGAGLQERWRRRQSSYTSKG